MKVLQVLGGGRWGGGCVVVGAYVTEMIRRGDEVWVVCLDDGVERRFANAGARTVRSPLWFHPINPFDVVPFLQLWWLCRRERFDLVATHTSKGGFIGRLAAKAAGVRKIVHHAHGFAFRETQARWIQRFYVELERIAARACTLIISVSKDHRRWGIRENLAPAEKIVAVLNGIETDLFDRSSRHDARRKLGIETEDTLIGVASRLAPKKGIGDLIQAFTEIHRSYPHTRLILVGEGPSRSELEHQAKQARVGNRIHFTGFLEDIPNVLAAFDIIVQPSISEGLSISLLEAMAAGRPVVACDITGNREVIAPGVSGILVPPSDPSALAAAIRLLLDDPKHAQELGAAAQAECRTRFTQRRMVSEILGLYDHVAAGNQRFEPQTSPPALQDMRASSRPELLSMPTPPDP
jgi:glycosyltransferase involved in cell wall biosynthesis